ncbi:MAG: hypothetical protein LQ350_006358 [Teloschistes chrysophthalmus]|nr:MAG: hypothetical protein LQ350_006358 [Niorma chrysophthalma]
MILGNISPLSFIHYRFFFGAIALVFIILSTGQRPFVQRYDISPSEQPPNGVFGDASPASSILTSPSKDESLTQLVQTIAVTSEYLADHPLASSEFGQMGKRIQILQRWIEARENLHSSSAGLPRELTDSIDKTTSSLFPFLPPPLDAPDDALGHFRRRFEKGSKGIVIPTGRKTFRYACHLISNMRDTLNSKLPIEIMYAGDSDLPLEYRQFITQLGPNIEVTDITQIFDDSTLDLTHGGWAIKPFAALASRFEQVMLLDADAIFLQQPESIFNTHTGYQTTGTLLFHDRLLWQGMFKDRHSWWEHHLAHQKPSQALSKSLVYNEGYAEEQDSGVVVLDKSRLPILLGLLHTCWQNAREVREKWTYKMGYGDKESWWFGLELVGAEYTFEEHYGSIIGTSITNNKGGKDRVCGFTIAHLDEAGKLLWYNGSLLKNKAVDERLFDVPTHWMVDGVWEKGSQKRDMSCVRDGRGGEMGREEREVVEKSVGRAREIDVKIEGIGEGEEV